jgi:hypothetical protein
MNKQSHFKNLKLAIFIRKIGLILIQFYLKTIALKILNIDFWFVNKILKTLQVIIL